MNILYLTNHLNIGGISSYVLTLARGLKKRGHNVYVASSGGELVDQFKKEGINYFPIPIKTKAEISPKILISLFKLKKNIRENKIDIIHANTRVTQVLACLLQKYTRRPFVSTCHGFFKKRILRRIFPCWGIRVIAISESVKAHLAQDFRIKEEKIRIIHNGVDVEKFKIQNPKAKSEAKKEVGLNDGPVVGIVARLSDVKGHVYLIRAMKKVLAEIPSAQLLIVGEGKMQKELIDLCQELAIKKSVIFLPSVSDTREALSLMDLFVMPSLKEGLGLALMEAMASGICVIGSYVGGIISLIQDRHNGVLVKPKDIEELAAIISELLKDPGKRAYFGKNAQTFISKNFSQEKMAEDTERLYQECLNEEI